MNAGKSKSTKVCCISCTMDHDYIAIYHLVLLLLLTGLAKFILRKQ